MATSVQIGLMCISDEYLYPKVQEGVTSQVTVDQKKVVYLTGSFPASCTFSRTVELMLHSIYICTDAEERHYNFRGGLPCVIFHCHVVTA